MKKLISSLGVFGSFVLILFFWYGEIFGIVHSIKRHSTKDVVASVFLPPWAWYRSLEIWWHDDYANVNWEKRLNNDLRSAIYFLSQADNKSSNQYQVNEDVESFSDKINKYPKDKKQYLKEGCRKFIAFSESTADDVIKEMNNFYLTKQFKLELSSNSKQLESELIQKFKLTDFVETIEKSVEETNQKMRDADVNHNFEQANADIAGYLNSAKTARQNELKRIFKEIFNEDL